MLWLLQVVALLTITEAVQWDAAWRRIVPRVEKTWSEAGVMRNVAPEAIGSVTTATLDAKSAPAAASLERLSAAAETGLDAVDKKFAAMEAEIASFCEEKGALLGSTEKALDKWTGDIARVSQQAMDKANAAVAMLVSTIKTLKETEAQLSAAEEELDIAKTDLGKTGAELRATTQELLKTKANL